MSIITNTSHVRLTNGFESLIVEIEEVAGAAMGKLTAPRQKIYQEFQTFLNDDVTINNNTNLAEHSKKSP